MLVLVLVQSLLENLHPTPLANDRHRDRRLDPPPTNLCLPFYVPSVFGSKRCYGMKNVDPSAEGTKAMSLPM